MTRLLVWLVLAILLVGAVVWLSKRDTTIPQHRVEKVIATDALPR